LTENLLFLEIFYAILISFFKSGTEELNSEPWPSENPLRTFRKEKTSCEIMSDFEKIL